MKTWKEITNEASFEPQYLRLTIKDGDLTREVVGMLIDEHIDKKSVPFGWYVYAIRHADDDWSAPATIEPNVLVNFMGQLLLDQPLFLTSKNNWMIEVVDYSYEDWEEIAYDALEEAGADKFEIDTLVSRWDNLSPIKHNVQSLLAPVLK